MEQGGWPWHFRHNKGGAPLARAVGIVQAPCRGLPYRQVARQHAAAPPHNRASTASRSSSRSASTWFTERTRRERFSLPSLPTPRASSRTARWRAASRRKDGPRLRPWHRARDGGARPPPQVVLRQPGGGLKAPSHWHRPAVAGDHRRQSPS